MIATLGVLVALLLLASDRRVKNQSQNACYISIARNPSCVVITRLPVDASAPLAHCKEHAVRALLLIVTVSSLFALPTSVTPRVAAATNLTRAEIRAMPIHNRPSRPGHFYGNTVRRRAGR